MPCTVRFKGVFAAERYTVFIDSGIRLLYNIYIIMANVSFAYTVKKEVVF